MSGANVATLEVGTVLPPLSVPALSRATLALYAGASGDHVPLHIDTDVARAAGMPDVFGHGMLTAAWLGRLLTNWVDQGRLCSMDLRFTGITHLGNAIVCTGRVTEKFSRGQDSFARIEVQATNQYGENKALGQVVIAL